MGRSHSPYTAGQRHRFRGRLSLQACCQHRPTNVIGVQGGGPVTDCKVQAHQAAVGVLLQRGEDEPAADRFNGRLKLSCLELQVGEPVEDLIGVQVPVFALEAQPVVESRGIAQREALQERSTREADRALEP